MECPNCSHDNVVDAKFCMECGEKLEKKCNNCGNPYELLTKFCGECGKPLITSAADDQSFSSSPKYTGAERRQLTVMFCGISDVNQKRMELGDEDFRMQLLSFQRQIKELVSNHGGHVAQNMDDGILAYFGYPRGLENAPNAAISAGKEILLSFSGQSTENRFLLKIGIHTGLVVVDHHLALGETTNLASRIQSQARPGQIFISKATKKLIEGWYATKSLGDYSIRGLERPMELFEVGTRSEVTTRLEAAKARGLSPLVDREEELSILQKAWDQAKNGHGQVVLLKGEAGIGKSRLLESIKEEILVAPNTSLLEVNCSIFHQNTIFYPIIQLYIGSILQFSLEDTALDKLSKIEAFAEITNLKPQESVPFLLELLAISPSENYPPLALTPAQKKKKLREIFLQALLNRSESTSVLVLVEDLHWSDPSTNEWLDLLVEQLSTYSIFAICTARPEYHYKWSNHSHATELKLRRLSADKIEEICRHQCQGKELPIELLKQIREKTDGIPLFVEELTRMVLDSEMIEESQDAYRLKGNLNSISIPSTLQDSLIARLDQLDSSKDLAQIGAVLGRKFTFDLLQSVSGRSAESLETDLKHLVDSNILFQRGIFPDTTYTFKHALFQDSAYDTLLKSRRQMLHQRVAEVLELQFEYLNQIQPELLAHHLTEALLIEKALSQWQLAAQNSIQKHSFIEGANHLKRALILLPQLQDSAKRDAMELEMLKVLTPSLQISTGYANAEVEKFANRWIAAAKLNGDNDQLFDALVGEYTYYTFSANYQKVEPVLGSLIETGRSSSDPYNLGMAYFFNAINRSLEGKLGLSLEQFEECLLHYDEKLHFDRNFYNIGNLKSVNYTYSSTPLYLSGYPDLALERMKEAIKVGYEVNHPGCIYSSAAFMGRLLLGRKEYSQVDEYVQPALEVATANDDKFLIGLLSFYSALGHAHLGSMEAAQKSFYIVNQLFNVYKSYRIAFLVFVADAFLKLDALEQATKAVDLGFDHFDKTHERLYLPELFRLSGLIAMKQVNNESKALGHWRQGLDEALYQGDLWHQLLLSTELSQYHFEKGNFSEALSLLKPIVDDFPEKAKVRDLVRAKNLLRLIQKKSATTQML